MNKLEQLQQKALNQLDAWDITEPAIRWYIQNMLQSAYYAGIAAGDSYKICGRVEYEKDNCN